MVNEADKFAKEKDTKNQADSVVYQTEKQLKGTRRQSSCICERKAGDQTR
ncbi:putative Heat shock protein 70kD domain superfamily [Helianthus annuus]|uniref:Heat shock protein 70kD domain superfamily n=2 Tax=Helianthus annuus TaxID=4232 RepID=A0A9K3JK57_HELAN|nr:putative Heat shock protein 70kD domain superfamily [Helianthus annuus]KAJ0594605.1 putative Heat shock protein 70kD domain superfamily [Helianthus annuus]KAJ0609653.1 putative Heat shock protein 70kD domain superfamily [Helianthus annuus]KAJ0769698.1 putative Heat shock protein 70kD domain superfamily [Helianthus annuus]KAJ0775428.1 putative Heat shock protein 70kD domain superfamily [Helianthus annuus]